MFQDTRPILPSSSEAELESTGPTADLAAGFAGGRRLWEGTPSLWGSGGQQCSGGRGRSGRKWKTTRIAQAHQNVLLGKTQKELIYQSLRRRKSERAWGSWDAFRKSEHWNWVIKGMYIVDRKSKGLPGRVQRGVGKEAGRGSPLNMSGTEARVGSQAELSSLVRQPESCLPHASCTEFGKMKGERRSQV